MNLELPFVDDLEARLRALVFTYTDGGTDRFTEVGLGKIPTGMGYPCAAIIPLGPNFPVEILGVQGLERRDKHVGVLIEVHYEHPDQRQGMRNMSDLLWQVMGALTDRMQPPFGGCENFVLGETDYAYVMADDDDNLQADWGFKSVAAIPVAGVWRYRK